MIDDFGPKTPHWFLSNFYPSTFTYEGVEYKSNEHFYQSHKAVEQVARQYIREAGSPGESKRRGRAKDFVIVPNWDNIWAKMVMRQGLYLKFFQNPDIMVKLIATGGELLIEGNTWNDRVWGQTWTGNQWVGKNQLGIMLMELRDGISKAYNAEEFYIDQALKAEGYTS